MIAGLVAVGSVINAFAAICYGHHDVAIPWLVAAIYSALYAARPTK